MKKLNYKPVAIVLAAALFSGCAGLQKMKKNADQIQFNVTPEVLEAHASEVDVAIDARFPAKYFNKKATLDITPVLRYDGGDTEFESFALQGENVEGNNRVIGYDSGGGYSYTDDAAYNEDMRRSELYVNITASKGAKSVDFDPIKIADGVIATSELVVNMPKPILGVRRDANDTDQYDPAIDPFQRIVPEEMLADIHYIINRANLRQEEVEADDVRAFEEYTRRANEDDRIDLKEVEVSAYASPDGELDFNTELAGDRKNSSSEYVAEQLRNAGIDINLSTRYMPEDWEGFRELLEASNIQDKELILRVLSMYDDPEVREREIRNLSETFTVLAEEILPELRRAKLLTSVDLIGKTDEELISLAQSDPGSLNQAELLYAATLFEDLDDQLEIYESFMDVYPDDWRGPNNAGYVLVMQSNYDDAAPLFEDAENLKNDEPVIKNNLAVIELYEGNVSEAETLLGAASGAGAEVNYNLGIVKIKQADYDRAVRYFGDFQDVNTALAKILTDDNNAALRDLESIDNPDCFMKPYLEAIIAARGATENAMYDNLAEAIEINPELKELARTDLEFARYFNQPRFQEIVE